MNAKGTVFKIIRIMITPPSRRSRHLFARESNCGENSLRSNANDSLFNATFELECHLQPVDYFMSTIFETNQRISVNEYPMNLV